MPARDTRARSDALYIYPISLSFALPFGEEKKNRKKTESFVQLSTFRGGCRDLSARLRGLFVMDPEAGTMRPRGDGLGSRAAVVRARSRGEKR